MIVQDLGCRVGDLLHRASRAAGFADGTHSLPRRNLLPCWFGHPRTALVAGRPVSGALGVQRGGRGAAWGAAGPGARQPAPHHGGEVGEKCRACSNLGRGGGGEIAGGGANGTNGIAGRDLALWRLGRGLHALARGAPQRCLLLLFSRVCFKFWGDLVQLNSWVALSWVGPPWSVPQLRANIVF